MEKHIETLTNSANCWERSSGVWLIGTHKLENHIKRIIALLSDEEPIVGERCAWALGRLGKAGTFTHLHRQYPWTNPWARPHFISAMQSLAGPEQIDDIRQLLRIEGDTALQARLVQLLQEVGGEKSIEIIAPYCGHTDDRLRKAALESISLLTGKDATPLLEKGLQDRNLKIRGMCGEMLLRMGNFRSLGVLSEMLNASERQQRVLAAHTLREMAIRQKQSSR